ncbi:MAG: hypothetical protein QOF17_406 [Solirubrobacteraceae bacterium]|jgi:hypothetical protein|nr:hypothetical protein [Solirubrobacteraceae bacterium]
MMLLLVGLLIAWVIASLFAVVLCLAAYRGDRVATMIRPVRGAQRAPLRSARAS